MNTISFNVVSVMIHGLIAEDEIIVDLFDTAVGPNGRESEGASRAKWEAVSDLIWEKGHMGQFSMEIIPLPGSLLHGNLQTKASGHELTDRNGPFWSVA